MKARIIVSAIALAFGVAPVLADRAQPRDGGSNRGGGASSGSAVSGAGARHPSSGGSSGSAHSGSRSGSSGSAESGSGLTDAQRRHPRPGTGTGHRGRVTYRSYPYFYYPGYYGYYGYGYYDWWYGPYGGYYGGYYPGYAYRYYDYDDSGALRLLVDPNQARVYVDGYYAGLVDDYDGLFQRLRLPPGRHEIAFKLEGYKTHRVRLYVPADQTLKIKHDLVQGEGEDSLDDALDKPALEWAERERQRDPGRDRRDRYDYRDRYDRDRRRDDEAREGRSADKPAAGDERAVPGSALLSLDVRPERAAVYVDGAFRGTARDVRELNLPPGRHHVEVVAPGFRTFDREVELKAGATETLSIELEQS